MTESDGENPNAADWRKALTKDERAELRSIERAIAKGGKAVQQLRAKRRKIQNRATQRSRYAVISYKDEKPKT